MGWQIEWQAGRACWLIPMDKLILVTGATGYIASRLIPRLLEAGYRVRCLARDPLRLKGRPWAHHVEVVQGDVTNPSSLPMALEGIHTAYYLIHNMTQGHGYTSLELESARAFTTAAGEAGVEHIIYLGGLADPEQHIAPHMRSRIETGRVLREGNVPVTEFRAGVIAGSGSISFEMIRFMTELFPIVPGPLWMKNKSQPIAIRNVIDYLLTALTNPNGRGRVFEIGGPDIAIYGDLMLRYARIRGLRRRMLLLPGIPVWFMAFGVGLLTPVPYPIAYALIGGLSADSVVKHPEALQVFPEVRLIDFDTATKDALEKTHPAHIERVWDDGRGGVKSIKHEGCFIHHREIQMDARPETVFSALERWVDQQAGFTKLRQMNEQMIVCRNEQVAGETWIEWRVGRIDRATSPGNNFTYLSQTVFFSPRGLPGSLYWYFLYPFHIMEYRGLIQSIVQQSKTS
jgi:uncharacterized protein YbjT (DUF2867 family)